MTLMWVQPAVSLTPGEIDERLVAIERQRSGDINQFEHLLSDINQYKFQFSNYQRCLYNYLELYNNALTDGYNQSLPGFQQLFESCDDLRIKIRVKNMEANIFSYMKQYRESIEALDYSLSHISEVNDKHLLTMVYTSAFIVYSYIEQFQLSLQFSELLMDESDLPSDQCKGKYNRIRIYLKNEKVSVTAQEVDQIFEYCQSVNEPIYAYLLKMEWFRHLLLSRKAQGNWQPLLLELEQIMNEINQLGYPYLSRHALLVKSQIMFLQGDEQTMDHVIAMLKLESENFDNSENKITFLKLMVAHHKRKNEADKALEYMEIAQEALDDFYHDKQNKQVAFQVVKHESMAGQLQNELLTKQNKILQIEQDLAKKNMLNQRLITAVVSLLGLLLIFWAVRLLRKHKSMTEAASRDFLTGCYNRQTFETQVKSMLGRLEIKDLILHLSIMDLDHFKSINDRFGHLKGDLVLKKVIAYCESQLTDRMLLGRLGGEEFGIFIVETNSREMMSQLNKLRDGIAHLDFDDIEEGLKMTASFGVASSITSGYQWKNLISHADEALYQAKEQGRNRVYRFDLAQFD